MNQNATCQNCGQEWQSQYLKPIKNVFERVAPGEVMPAGECPSCGALCHLIVEAEESDLPHAVAHRQHDFGSLGMFFFSTREKALRYAASIVSEELEMWSDDAAPIAEAINEGRCEDALEMWRELDGNLDHIDMEPITFDLFDSDAPIICDGDFEPS